LALRLAKAAHSALEACLTLVRQPVGLACAADAAPDAVRFAARVIASSSPQWRVKVTEAARRDCCGPAAGGLPDRPESGDIGHHGLSGPLGVFRLLSGRGQGAIIRTIPSTQVSSSRGGTYTSSWQVRHQVGAVHATTIPDGRGSRTCARPTRTRVGPSPGKNHRV